MKRQYKVGLAALAVFTAACSDTDPMGPGPISLTNSVTEDVCETITFSGPGHMEAVGNISAFGLTLTTSGTIFTAADGSPAAGAMAPVVFFTQLPDSVEDDDLQSTPPWGDCLACAGLGNIMTLPDVEQNPANPADPELPAGSPWISVFYGDYRWGGTMRISGFTGGDYYIKSFKAIDQEDTPGAIRVYANGTGVLGTASGLGDGSVETVTTTETNFTDWLEFANGTEAQDQINGSGGVDDIVVCKRTPPPPPPGEGTRTPGYWRQDHKPWPVDQITIGGIVYTRAQAQALMFASGSGDKTYGMFDHLVAAKLNLLSGSDPSCIQTVVNNADTWMTTYPVGSNVKANDNAWKNPVLGLPTSAGTMHTTLDQYNNGLLCAPKAD